ncbi:MAG: YHS domain-containing protein, partial [Thermodesulfobacteriota bacterium]
MTQDPVCGMTVEKSKAAGSFLYKEKQYFFCSLKCKEKFTSNPREF